MFHIFIYLFYLFILHFYPTFTLHFSVKKKIASGVKKKKKKSAGKQEKILKVKQSPSNAVLTAPGLSRKLQNILLRFCIRSHGQSD